MIYNKRVPHSPKVYTMTIPSNGTQIRKKKFKGKITNKSNCVN